MRQLNPSHVNALIELINHGLFIEHLSMVIKELGVGYSFLEVDVEEKHHNPFGSIHGGVYASVIDTAAYWAAYCELAEDAGMVTLEFKVNNIAAIKRGKILVKGQSIKVGRTVALVEAIVTNLDEKILAQGTSTLMLTPGRQTISEALNLIGATSLPPKFLV